MEPDHLAALVATYGAGTWRIYEHLDESLDPTGPDELYDIAADLVRPGDVVLDAGCRDADHLIELCRRHEVTGVGVDPVPQHIARATTAVAAAGLDGRITLHAAMLEQSPVAAGSVDLIWCRDVLEQVADLPSVVQSAARLLRTGGAMIVFTVVDNGLSDADLAVLSDHRGVVAANLDPGRLEASYTAAGLSLERTVEIGTRWREHAEERTRPVSRKLLQLARLRRRRAELTAEYGAGALAHVEANLQWELWQFLGVTLPIVQVLRKEP